MAQQFFQGKEIFPGQSIITDPANMMGFLVNSQGKRFRKRFQPGQQPDNTFFASDFGTPPISGPEEQEFANQGRGLNRSPVQGRGLSRRPIAEGDNLESALGQLTPPPFSRRPVAPRPGFGPGFQGAGGLPGILQPPPTTPRRVQRSFTEGLTAPGLGVGNRAIGNLLEMLFGRF